jgi:hypothetical protein
VAVTAANVIMGPGTLYIGTFGATEPTDLQVSTTPSSAAWTDLGGTDDGATLTLGNEYADLTVDQIALAVGARLNNQVIGLEVNLAEVTLANLKWALNGGTTGASGTGWASYDPISPDPAAFPNYAALILDGPAPSSTVTKNRRVILRKVLNVEQVKAPYKKGDQMFWPVNFKGFYVSSTILPFHIVELP